MSTISGACLRADVAPDTYCEGMAITRIRTWYYSLTKLETVMALTIITIAGLLLFRLPEVTYFKALQWANMTLRK
jgi:hypothetical protein